MVCKEEDRRGEGQTQRRRKNNNPKMALFGHILQKKKSTQPLFDV